MELARLQTVIDAAWEDRAQCNFETKGEIRAAVNFTLGLLDEGKVRVAEKVEGSTGKEAWITHQWLKKAVLLSFRLNDMMAIPGGPGGTHWWDKVHSKFEGWSTTEFRHAGFRAVPNCIVRRSAYIAPGVVLMPPSSISVPMSPRVRWSTPG
jgi:2,3,4,5-tetrahydropyridine-2-carboxylate N-succinyltransferase